MVRPSPISRSTHATEGGGAFYMDISFDFAYAEFLVTYLRLAFSASISRLHEGAYVVRDASNLWVIAVVSSTA